MQVSRMNKLVLLPVIFRCYGTQRLHRNYYEILEVPPDCSQKEIRRAFLVLSKKWHPDIIGDKGHDQFVKVQEAYNVLSKENTRKQYDLNLKYHTNSPYSSPYVRPEYPSDSGRVYRSRREWEEHMARGNWQPPQFSGKNNEARNMRFIAWFTVFWVVLVSFQFLVLHNRMLSVKRNLQYEYQNDYNLMRKSIQGLTLDEQLNVTQNRYDLAQAKNKKGDENEK